MLDPILNSEIKHHRWKFVVFVFMETILSSVLIVWWKFGGSSMYSFVLQTLSETSFLFRSSV
jgi:hypothetical protein